MCVKIHIHDKEYNKKPRKKEIAEISATITNKITELSVLDFSEMVGERGKTFLPAVFSNARKKENFISQQLYALDFDDGFSVEKFNARAKEYDIQPAFIYDTFSNIEIHPRFRAVFINDCEVKDVQAASILTKMLLEIFPEADSSCKDVTRMFFGGKGLRLVNANMTINLFDVSLSLQAYLSDKDNKNYTRKIKQIGKKLNVAVKNNMLCIHKLDSNSKISENEDFCINTSNIRVNIQNSSFFYIIEKDEERGMHQRSRRENRKGKMSGRIQNVSVKILKENCMLFKEFYEEELSHEFKFMIATNLMQLVNGKQIFFCGKIEHVSKWQQTWKYIQKNQYVPQQCKNSGCPYYEECGSSTIIECITSRIRKIRDEDFVEVYEAEKILREEMMEAVMACDEDIHLISAQTSLGKTFSYCQIIKNYYIRTSFMIVVPTVKLQEEVGKELQEMGVPILLTPNIGVLLQRLHLEDLKADVDYLYKRGFGFKVKNTIRNYIKENRNHLGEWQLKQLEEFLKSTEKIAGSKCVVTTHAMFLSLPYEKISNFEIIVDEDILMTIFKNTSSIAIEDIELALEKKVIPAIAMSKVHQLLRANDGEIIRGDARDLGKDHLERIYDKNLWIDASLVDFLQADTYHIDKENKRINYFNARQIPKVKMTIVSATLNDTLYRNYCRGRTIHKAMVPIAKYKGKLIEYTKHSMSRSNISDLGYEKILKKAEEIAGDSEKNIITFKQYSQGAEIYYGRAEGYNEYKGKNLIVIGTPHNVPFVYYLIGAYLGYKTDEKLCVQYIENEIYSFPFMTFKNDEMKNLQFYFVESEIEQAIGRARLLRCECTVYLFSNFPCRQACIIQSEYLDE